MTSALADVRGYLLGPSGNEVHEDKFEPFSLPTVLTADYAN